MIGMKEDIKKRERKRDKIWREWKGKQKKGRKKCK